jgi:hypothetical protein
MAVIEDGNILGLRLGSEIVCRDCSTEEEEESAKSDNIIFADENATDWVFCDRCQKRMI